MDKLFNWLSIIIGFCGGFLSFHLGGWDMLLKTVVALSILDYGTGWIKGIYTKEISSEIGFKGILKKILMFVVIALSFKIQELIGATVPLREVVITFYICNEALSILENAAMFIPVPEKIKEILLQLREEDNLITKSNKKGR